MIEKMNNMHKPKVTVVIPTYNREKVIERCIKSVIGQTYKNFELIIVDDGSIDHTHSIVEKFDDTRIQYIYQDNSGSQAARNNGLHHASGEYISFLDSDDYWFPNFLEETLKAFQENPEIGCAYCQSGVYVNNRLHYAHYDKLSGNIYKKALKQGYITSPTFLLIKKSCFEKIGDWDTNLIASQDDDICFRLAKLYKYKLVNKILAVYTFDGTDKIMGSKFRVSKGFYDLWCKYEDDVYKMCGRKTIGRHFLNCYLSFIACNKEEYAYLADQKTKKYLKPVEYKMRIAMSKLLNGRNYEQIKNRLLTKIKDNQLLWRMRDSYN